MAVKKNTKPARRKIVAPKDCYFCTEKKNPTFADVSSLQRYITERGKIMGRVRTGICAMHQNDLTLAIKHARHLALLPFVIRG